MKTRLEQRGATLILVIYYGLRYPEALWAPSVCTSMHELKHLGPQGVPQPRTSAKKDHQCRKHIVQTHLVFIKCVSSTVCQRKTSVPKTWPSLKQTATPPSPSVTLSSPTTPSALPAPPLGERTGKVWGLSPLMLVESSGHTSLWLHGESPSPASWPQ